MQRLVVVSGSRLHPELEVFFERADVEADAWVRSLPQRTWSPERRCWVVTALGDARVPDGFTVVDWDDQPGDVEHLRRPVATASGHDTYTVAIHPRLSGRDKVRARVGADSLWRDDVCLSRPEHVGLDWCDDAPNEVSAALVAPAATVDAGTVVPLRFDGTVDGLRGTPLVDLDSVSPDAAVAFYAMGITNIYELLHTVPRRYIDLSNPLPIGAATVGDKVAIVGTVGVVSHPTHRGGMGRAQIVDAHGTKLYCRWFNAGWAVRRLTTGANVMVFGTMEEFVTDSGFRGRAMTNPLLESLDRSHSQGVIGVYPASAKHELTTWQTYNAANEAVRRLPAMHDTVPEHLRERHHLMERQLALRAVHNPSSLDEAEQGRNRLAYDELLYLQLALLVARAQQGGERGIVMDGDGHLRQQVLAALPFELTDDQSKAVEDMLADARSERAGARLLMGRVGSGKTLTVLMGMLNAVESGHQAALMAPTEVLATQHHLELCKRLEGVTHRDGRPVRVELLTNKVTGKDRKAVLAGLVDGEVDIVVGTHSLLADSVVFARLGMAVVDEQHRFGVEQRNALKNKGAGGRLCDLIYATATPIPRTIAMTVFGDLDQSVITHMPPGRTPVATSHFETAPLGDAHHPVWSCVREEVAKGRQAFVVCPMVSESQAKEAAAAVQTAEQLRTGALAGLRIGVVTGKQKPEERTSTMTAFENGELDVLVATTVIEVGVNVPNATAIVILGADRFGIAQNHQLRGRVGRGQHPGVCLLVAAPRTKQGEARIKALLETTDDFLLSDIDLSIRGAGSMLSAEQSGVARDMRVADILNDVELVSWAKADAAELVADDPTLARHPALRDEVARALGPDAATWLTSA